MAMTIHVDIVSAEKLIFSGSAEMVVVPAVMGDIGIVPRHTPLLTTLRPGQVKVKSSSSPEEYFYVSGGLLEIQPHNVTILTDTADRAKNLDEAKAKAAKEEAERQLQAKSGEFDYARARLDLARATAQLKTIETWKQHKNKHHVVESSH